MKASVALITAVMAASSFGLVTAYKVEPVKAQWSGKADPEDGVSQVITCNFDLPITASLFCGSPGAGGAGAYQIPA